MRVTQSASKATVRRTLSLSETNPSRHFTICARQDETNDRADEAIELVAPVGDSGVDCLVASCELRMLRDVCFSTRLWMIELT